MECVADTGPLPVLFMCFFNSKCTIVYFVHACVMCEVCAHLLTCAYYNYASLSKLAWVCCRYEHVCAKWYHPVRHVCDRRTQGVLFRSDLPGTSKHPPQRASHTQHSMACQHHLTRRFIFSTGCMCARTRVLMRPAFLSLYSCVCFSAFWVPMYDRSTLCCSSECAHAYTRGPHVQASSLWFDCMINRLISTLSGAKQCRPEASSAWTCVGIKKQRSIVHVLWNPREGWRQRAEALIKSSGRKVRKYMGHFFSSPGGALFETDPGIAQIFELLNSKLEFEGWQWGRWGIWSFAVWEVLPTFLGHGALQHWFWLSFISSLFQLYGNAVLRH